MIGLWAVAGSIILLAAAIFYCFRPDSDVEKIRAAARIFVRAAEMQGSWIPELRGGFQKKEFVMAQLQEQFSLSVRELDAVVEEAVFDMHCDWRRNEEVERGTVGAVSESS